MSAAAPSSPRANVQPLVVLVAVILTAGASIATVGIQLHRETMALEDARETLSTLARRAETLNDQSSRRQRLQEVVNALDASGFVTTQRAPRWPQALRTAGFADAEIEFLSDPTMSTAALTGDSDVILRDSVVRVRMPVLHEVELLRRLDALSAVPVGIMRAQSCSLRRSVMALKHPETPLLSADCEIGWTDALVNVAQSR